MGVADELMAIERELALGRGDVYARVLHDDAVVVVPGAVLTRRECVAAMDESPGWDDVDLGEPRLVESGTDGDGGLRVHGAPAAHDLPRDALVDLHAGRRRHLASAAPPADARRTAVTATRCRVRRRSTSSSPTSLAPERSTATSAGTSATPSTRTPRSGSRG